METNPTRSGLESDPRSVPLGDGPFERLLGRHLRGELDVSAALQVVSEERISRTLSPAYVRAVLDWARAQVEQRTWREPLFVLELLRSALEADDLEPELAPLRGAAAAEYLTAAAIALWDIPDPALYRAAVDAGERACERAKGSEDRALFGLLLHNLGTLHLDPFTAHRDANNYEHAMREWRNRVHFALPGHEAVRAASVPIDATGKKDPGAARLPMPAEAIERAESYYRRATDIRDGSGRGASLKALVQCLQWRSVVGLEPRGEEAVEVAKQALAVLDPVRQPHLRVEMLRMLAQNGEPVHAADLEALLNVSLDGRLESEGPLATIDLVLSAAALLVDVDAHRGLALLDAAENLFARHGSSGARASRFRLQRVLLREAYAPKWAPPPGRHAIAELAGAALEQAEEERWDPAWLAAILLRLAGETPASDEEALGVHLLELAEEAAPITLEPRRDAIDALRAGLWVNAGAGAVGQGDLLSAIECYASGLRLFAWLQFDDSVTDCLNRIADVVSDAGAAGVRALVDELGDTLQTLARRGSEAQARRIRQLGTTATAALGSDAIDPNVLHDLWSICKGQSFAARFASGAAYRYRETEEGQEILASIAELSEEAGERDPGAVLGNPQIATDEALLLSPHSASGLVLSGTTPAERLANLHHGFDSLVNELLAEAAEAAPDMVPDLDQVQQALDPETVLVRFFVGAAGDGTALYRMVVSQDQVGLGVVRLGDPEEPVRMRIDGHEVEVSGMAERVRHVRRAVQDDPEEGPVSHEAAERLRHATDTLLGGLADELRPHHEAGRRHLCIVPDGPLHYLPFHVLGTDPLRPLAADWVVTYLPNLQLEFGLAGERTLRRHRPDVLTAFGVSFDAVNPFGLEPLPEAPREATRVAELFGVPPLLDDAVTEEAIRDALANSRYVHLATHGAHNIVAPAFHCLYCSPGEDSDGRLFAHEILSLDLRGLELLTLGACETSLGRFDVADNLLGLPATFLLSGASAIVGTLWPVETMAAEHFFTSLYGQLRAGAGRLDAFAAAQRETRHRHPEHRDWGAFQYIGDW